MLCLHCDKRQINVFRWKSNHITTVSTHRTAGPVAVCPASAAEVRRCHTGWSCHEEMVDRRMEAPFYI